VAARRSRPRRPPRIRVRSRRALPPIGARHPRRPSPLEPAGGSSLTWADCLDRGDEERIWDCLREHLGARSDAAQIGRHLCTSGRDPATAQALLLAAALERVPATEALAWLREIEVACPRFLGWSVLEHACELLRARDPSWLQRFVAALTPDRLFAEDSGESGFLIAAHLLEKATSTSASGPIAARAASGAGRPSRSSARSDSPSRSTARPPTASPSSAP
jgi:hypothetical protein